MFDLIPIVGILASLIGLPAIIVAAVVGSKYVKYKNEELRLRREELELHRQRLQMENLRRENELLDRQINDS